jgi:7-carboxy-7-deazaguanine synthase
LGESGRGGYIPVKYKINEIFYSIQGEGYNTGLPVAFIRFAGCNLKCPWCDTKYHEAHFELDEAQILARVEQYPTQHVIFTGGEPMLQDLGPLWSALKRKGFWIGVETNGTRPIVQSFDWVTISPKGLLEMDEAPDEVKVIYTGQDPAHFLKVYPNTKYFYLQPCSGKNIRETVDYVLAHPEWRLSLQCQKLIGIA